MSEAPSKQDPKQDPDAAPAGIDRYALRGVSAAKTEVHEAIKGLDKGLFPKAFCKILPDIAGGDAAWANCLHADTAGTKTSLAYCYWRETGDLSVWRGIVQDALVMNLDDMGCVGAVNDILISSTIGRNKHCIPGEVVKALIQGTTAFLDQLNDLGIRIHHGGGETADVGDIVRTVDVGFTAFARLPREQVLVNAIRPGADIVGLASYGQTSYEDRYNGGMGSNGLTSARHDLFGSQYAERYPESFDPSTDPSVVYTGSYQLSDAIPAETPGAAQAAGLNMGQLVLSPTRTYLPFMQRAIAEHRTGIQGMIHCTGGAQTKVLHFAEGVRIVKDQLFSTPPLFRLIQQASGTEWEEMYRVFNMGHRLEVYCDPAITDALIALAGEWKIPAQRIGHVEAVPVGDNASVAIRGEHGQFHYAGQGH